jgi:hypothetical protein
MAKRKRKRVLSDEEEWERSLRPPRKITINHDDRHARYMGRTVAGEQFFITAPYVEGGPAQRFPRRDFVALYVFDKKGALVRSKIIDLGTREKKDAQTTRALKKRAAEERDKLLASLGEVTYGDISVAPFTVKKFKIEFGLSHSGPEDPFDPWLAAFTPGAYMKFTQPWDSGTYETEYEAEPLF